MRVQRRFRSVSVALTGLALLGVLVACSDSSTSDETTSDQTMSATTSASATASATDECADVTALENSLQALNEVNPVADGTDALNAAIDDVASSLDAARDSASEELQPQLEDAAHSLRFAPGGRDRPDHRQNPTPEGAGDRFGPE